MNIKMRDKDNKNIKTKITLKTFLAKKSQQQSFPLNSINIQTITTYKNNNKKLFNTKDTNSLKYLNTPNSNNTNNYIINEDNLSFSCYNSNQEPSPINSLNSSYSTYTKKKRNHKRHKKKYKNNNINTLDSINNLSLNSNIINTNNSVSSHSSNNSSYNECSDSSDISFQSRDYKRKNYYELMMAEENEIDYLSRKEVGLISSDEEDNNNSVDNNNSIEDNFSNEIERILIEIYNKNISIISSGEYNDNKNNFDIDDIEKQIKKYLKKQNFKTNLLVLKCLSNKIKELIGKYREKVFEIEEIKKIYETNKLKRQLMGNNINNNRITHSSNSIGSNLATNSNSSYDSNNNNEEDLFYKNTLLLKVQDEMTGKGITNILLRELINIKKTLKISSKEIESIFKYPLSILRNDNGKKIKFSIELMQLEEFCKILLNDELISTLLLQMKLVFSQFKMPEIIQLIDQVQDESSHKNEMTRFDKYINDKLGISNTINEKNNNNNVMSDTYETENDFTFNNNNNNENNNNNLNNSEKNQIIKNNNNNEVENNNNINNKKYDNNSGADSASNNSEENKFNFQDIDELLNYINEETDSKKGKKKNKKNRKNKKFNNKENIEITKNDNVDKEIKCQIDDDFDNEFEQFKKDIKKDSIYFYEFNKISPCLSDEFLEKIGCM